MDLVSVLAIGIDHGLRTEAGGRETPLLGGYDKPNRFTDRPDWGLPGWSDGEQTASPVLGFAGTTIHPGERVRAILVPPFLDRAHGWRIQGDRVRLAAGTPNARQLSD